MEDVEELMSFKKHIHTDERILHEFMGEFISHVSGCESKDKIDTIFQRLRAKHHIAPSKGELREMYMKSYSHIPVSLVFKSWLVKKAMRSNSGVLVVTIVLSPHKFSCKYDCHYCPSETDLNGVPTQPRSYLSSEPAMLRALASDFDVKGQFQNRIKAYRATGNIGLGATSSSSKIEVILSGGTWESYPIEYREQVILELFWAANTIDSEERTQPRTLEEEQTENETADFRIIGLTLETRPDNITPLTIQDYVRWGATRIQMGVQHFDDTVLKKVNRKCYTIDTIRAIRLLKQAGFKVVVHLMPDLPGSSVALDNWMFDQAVTNPDLQFDDVKIYPTAICKSSDPGLIVKSKIADWHAAGEFTPYAEKNLDDLMGVLRKYKARVQPWIRIQRLVRDIPSKSIESGYHKMSNLRQILKQKMDSLGEKCHCTFCMEIGENQFDTSLAPLLVVRRYEASQGVEYYLSVEAHRMSLGQKVAYWVDRLMNILTWFVFGVWEEWHGDLESYVGLYGFLRLRIEPESFPTMPQIAGCGLVREVHVYGTSLGVGADHQGSKQHRGYGRLLMKTAELIAASHYLQKTAVIAGVGTREYYRNKCGYELVGGYMVKNILPYNGHWIFRGWFLFLCWSAYSAYSSA